MELGLFVCNFEASAMVFPMAFVTVPIAFMVVVPIFILPIVVPSILIRLGW